jgi:hypothetical protein
MKPPVAAQGTSSFLQFGKLSHVSEGPLGPLGPLSQLAGFWTAARGSVPATGDLGLRRACGRALSSTVERFQLHHNELDSLAAANGPQTRHSPPLA